MKSFTLTSILLPALLLFAGPSQIRAAVSTHESRLETYLATLHVGMAPEDAERPLKRWGCVAIGSPSLVMKHRHAYLFLPDAAVVTLQYDAHNQLISWEGSPGHDALPDHAKTNGAASASQPTPTKTDRIDAAPASTNTNAGAIPPNIFKPIEQHLPGLRAVGITNGTASSAEAWQGDEYASAGFIWAKDAGVDPRKLALQGLPYLCLGVTIHHYASAADVQKDLDRGFHTRPALPPPKEMYKGAALYRYTTGGGNVICQFGRYIIELSPMPRSGITPSLVMKVLDIVLAELGPTSSKTRESNL